MKADALSKVLTQLFQKVGDWHRGCHYTEVLGDTCLISTGSSVIDLDDCHIQHLFDCNSFTNSTPTQDCYCMGL